MMPSKTETAIPGELPGNKGVARMIRVDHAGEYGAQRIYEGQLAMLKGAPSEPVIQKMYEQEKVHLETFEQLIQERAVRPTALLPLWHVGGFLMGATTAMLGEKAAMACTVAVEEVIGEHYGRQESALTDEEKELKATITQFRAEELEHHDTGLEHGAEEAPMVRVIHGAVSRITKTAIWLSERV